MVVADGLSTANIVWHLLRNDKLQAVVLGIQDCEYKLIKLEQALALDRRQSFLLNLVILISCQRSLKMAEAFTFTLAVSHRICRSRLAVQGQNLSLHRLNCYQQWGCHLCFIHASIWKGPEEGIVCDLVGASLEE